MTEYVNTAGNTIRLDGEIARGGEGAIYTVAGNPDALAKIYARPPAQALREKLAFMAANATPELLEFFAWPEELLYQEGQLRGFVMPRIADAHELHQFTDKRDRQTLFPGKDDKRFAAHVAMNVASAFYHLHRFGHVAGDVNMRNILLNQQGQVRIIDCGSFQITTPQGAVYPCPVGVEEFMAPELQGGAWGDKPRTEAQDDFAMAVVFFMLLCNGRHPFAGLPPDGREMTLGEKIKEKLYAYSRASKRQLMPPRAEHPEDMLPPALVELFERAFTLSPGVRPNAKTWRGELEKLDRGPQS